MRIILLFLAFAASGSGALLYQVTWQRVLGLYFGVGSVATALVVAFSLLGLGLGGVFSGIAFRRLRLEGGAKHYVILELLVGGVGIIGGIFAIWLSSIGVSFSSGWVISALLLTILFTINFGLGVTFPMMVSVASKDGNGGVKLGRLYAVNTAGACIGCVIGPFLVFPLFGLVGGMFLASIFNMVAGGLAVLGTTNSEESLTEANEGEMGNSVMQPSIVVLSFLSGFLTLGMEIIWFRVVGLIVKPTAYTFGVTLGVFLLGITLGGALYGKFRLRLVKAGGGGIIGLLGLVCLLSLVPLGFLGQMGEIGSLRFVFAKSFEQFLHPPISREIDSWLSFWLNFDVFFVPVLIMMPATLVMGMVFPALIEVYSKRGTELRISASWIYGSNVIGNFLAVLFVGYVGFDLFGTEWMLVAVSAVGALFYTFSFFMAVRSSSKRYAFLIGMAACLMAGVSSHTVVREIHMIGAENDPYLASAIVSGDRGEILTEDKEGVVWSAPGILDSERLGAVSNTTGEAVLVYIGGTRHGILPPSGFIHNRIVSAYGYVPSARKVFVLGLGSGGYVGSLLMSDVTEAVDVAEISSALIENLKSRKTHEGIFKDPRFDLRIGDGRKILARSGEKYDLISVDPLRDTTALSNNLYSAEFFKICLDHLNENGIVVIRRGRGSVIEQTLAEIFPSVVAQGSSLFGIKNPDFDFSKSNVIRNRRNHLPEWAEQAIEVELLGEVWEEVQRDENLEINRDFFPVSEYYLFR